VATTQFSATVDEVVYGKFEEARKQSGENRSQAVEDALKLWLKARTNALIAEGCQVEREENLALARASKRKSYQVLAKSSK